VEFQRYCGGGGSGCGCGGVGGGGGGREEEVSLGVIITNTEIKFHILLFTLSSSSVSQSLSFNLLQSLYCPLFLVLTLCLQIKVGFFSVLSIRRMQCPFSMRYEVLPDVNCQLRGFDDNVEVFSQMISPVHVVSIFHSTDQIVHHLRKLNRFSPN
jgi:hypothetical protein